MAYLDPDYRKEPKTKVYCVRCQKDIRPDKVADALRVTVDYDNWQVTLGGTDLMGKDCARIIGLEFTEDKVSKQTKLSKQQMAALALLQAEPAKNGDTITSAGQTINRNCVHALNTLGLARWEGDRLEITELGGLCLQYHGKLLAARFAQQKLAEKRAAAAQVEEGR